MRRLSRLIVLTALAGAVGLGVAVTTHERPAPTTAAIDWSSHHKTDKPPTTEGHYWS